MRINRELTASYRIARHPPTDRADSSTLRNFARGRGERLTALALMISAPVLSWISIPEDYLALYRIVVGFRRRAQASAATMASDPSIVPTIAVQLSPCPRITTADTATDITQ